MRVILRADTDGLGKKGDVLEVADGYGRNYLVPTGRAFVATKGALSQAETMRRSRDLKDVRDRESAEEAAKAIAERPVLIEARAGAGGKLFGSVGLADIADATLAQIGVALDKRRVELEEPIRYLGRHEVLVNLHAGIEATLVVEVSAAS